MLENGKAVDGPMLETAVEPEKEPAPVASAPELKGIRGCSARIAIKDASVFIDRVPVLYDINWTINPGENWAVLGGNGAGKSTLLRLLAGDEIVAYGGEIVRELPRQGAALWDRLEVLRKGVRLVSDRQQATYTYDITGEELVFSGIDNSVGVYREPSEKELAQVTDILASLHLEFLAKRTIRSCSTRGNSAACSLPEPLPGNRISCCLMSRSQASTPRRVTSSLRCSTSLRGRACR